MWQLQKNRLILNYNWKDVYANCILYFYQNSNIRSISILIPWAGDLQWSDRWSWRNKDRDMSPRDNLSNHEYLLGDDNWSIPFCDLAGIPWRLLKGCTLRAPVRLLNNRSVDSDQVQSKAQSRMFYSSTIVSHGILVNADSWSIILNRRSESRTLEEKLTPETPLKFQGPPPPCTLVTG